MSFADAKQRFSNRVTDYVRYRPSYPPALLDLLRSECSLCPEQVIADIGSGTGLLSKLFSKMAIACSASSRMLKCVVPEKNFFGRIKTSRASKGPLSPQL